MQSKKFLKPWAIALTLPIFSITVATAAVAVQDNGALTNNQQIQEQQIQNQDQLQTPTQIKTNEVNWRRLRTQDPGNAVIPTSPFGDQDGVIQDNDFGQPPQDLSQAIVPVQPATKIDENYAGWNAASTSSSGRLGESLRACWVSLDRNGILHGTVGLSTGTEIDDIKVFIVQKGRLITSIKPNQAGEFSVEGLDAGVYSVFAYGKNAFLATSFIALKYRESNSNHPTSIHLQAVEKNGFLISDLVKQLSPQTSFRTYDMYDVAQGSDDPSRLYGFDGLANHDPSAIPSNSIAPLNVALDNGRLVGRIHQIDGQVGRPLDIHETTVHLVQDDKVIAETQADKYGVFEFINLDPGYYGIVAGGKDGFGAVGVELVGSGASVDDSDASLTSQSGTSLVSYNENASSNLVQEVFDMNLTDPESIGWLNNFVTEQSYVEAIETPLPQVNNFFQPGYDPNNMLYGGDYGGGGLFGDLFGGGGGGGFGFGAGPGLEGLALPVGLGAIIIESLNDNDGGIPSASPFNN